VDALAARDICASPVGSGERWPRREPSATDLGVRGVVNVYLTALGFSSESSTSTPTTRPSSRWSTLRTHSVRIADLAATTDHRAGLRRIGVDAATLRGPFTESTPNPIYRTHCFSVLSGFVVPHTILRHAHRRVRLHALPHRWLREMLRKIQPPRWVNIRRACQQSPYRSHVFPRSVPEHRAVWAVRSGCRFTSASGRGPARAVGGAARRCAVPEVATPEPPGRGILTPGKSHLRWLEPGTPRR